MPFAYNGPLDHSGITGINAFIPLWLVLLLTAIPTAWLWHRDRRRIRPGCCLRCGYDLTGNMSGICSECGERRPNVPKTGTHEAVEAKG